MKDFVEMDLVPRVSDEDIAPLVKSTLSGFQWRQGDSDAQGPYMTGRNDDLVVIKLWLGERPIEMSISFRGAWVDMENRDYKKKQVVDEVQKKLLAMFEISRLAI